MFLLLNETLKSSLVNISTTIIQHLNQLSFKFDLYFPEDPRPGTLWILNPLTVDSAREDIALPLELENGLIELYEDSTLKLQHEEVDLPTFRIKAGKEYSL